MGIPRHCDSTADLGSELYFKMIEASSIGYAAFDLKGGHLLWFNKACQDIVFMSQLKRIAKTAEKPYVAIEDLFAEEHLEKLAKLKSLLSSQERVFDHLIFCKRGKHRTFPAQINLCRYRDDQREILSLEILDLSVYQQNDQLQIQNEQLRNEIKKRQTLETALQKSNEKLFYIANHDALTEIPNRRYFFDRVENIWAIHGRESIPLSILLFDIDYFKQYNDFYGHQKGDECLKLVAKCLRDSLGRKSDLLARYGGEEFVGVLTGTANEGLNVVCKRIIENINIIAIPHAKSKTSKIVTVSCGGASVIPNGRITLKDVLEIADKKLYEVKSAGRNGFDSENLIKDSHLNRSVRFTSY